MSAHHHVEHAEHTEHIAHSNKNVALLIAVLALFLAFSETLGKSAQTAALNHQIEASNLWNFFQAKNIRRTVTIVAAESAKSDAIVASDPAQKEALAKQIDNWTKTAERYRTEPEAGGGKGEGTIELSRRALEEQDKARHDAGEISSLRDCFSGLPDRHRAVLGGGHHQHDGAGLYRGRPCLGWPRIHRHRAVRAERGASVLNTKIHAAGRARMRRRMRQNNLSARPAR